MTKESLGNNAIDCRAMADEILNSITGYGHLAVISVGGDPASVAYMRGKHKDCQLPCWLTLLNKDDLL